MATATATPPAQAVTGQKKGKQPQRSFSERWLDKKGWARRVPLLPALIFIVVMTQLPFVATILVSFTNWNANYPDEIKFGTLRNFATVFTDASLRSSVLFTILLTVTVVLVSLAFGLGIALLLNRNFIGRGVVRTMMIAPFLVVPVAAALLWKHAMYNPEYTKAAGSFADATLKAIESADPTNPGVQPRPTVGIQFVDIPEFTDLGTKVSQDVSGVIAGKTTVDEALDNGQKLAETVAEKYKGK